MEQRPDQQPDYDQPGPFEPTRSRGDQARQHPPQDSYAAQAPYASGQRQYPQQPYPQQPYYGQPYPPQPAPPKKKRGAKIAGFGCLGVVGLVVIVAIAAAVGGSKTTNSTAANVQSTTAATRQTSGAAPISSSAAPAAPAKTVVLTKSGEGLVKTKSFTVGDDWSLTYSFDCSSFGMQGNFQVYEDYPDGQVLVNALAKKGSDVTYQTGDAGKHSLEVSSECDWKITVTNNDDGQ